jgi:hypothetical protein
MPTRQVPRADPADVVADHPHLLQIVTVDLKVSQIKYILRRLTDALKPVMSNARDTTIPEQLRQHYVDQQKLIIELMVTLQQALDREPVHERPTD